MPSTGKLTMDDLPAELIHEIIAHLDPSCRKNARLTCRRFNSILCRQSFSILPSFIDPAVALATLESTRAAMSVRRRPIWSPHCSVPDDLPVPQSFLLAMYVALKGQSWRAGALEWESDTSSEEESVDGLDSGEVCAQITVENLRVQLCRHELSEGNLRQAMFRYALYLSYIYSGEGEAPQLWVFDTKLWAAKA